jgi:hypothetical protein
MKTLGSAVATALVGVLGPDVAHASGPDYFGIPVKWWLLVVVVLLILNLACCWWRRR